MVVFCSGDCGVYTPKYIETLSAGKQDLQQISDKTIDIYRVLYSNTVFDGKWMTKVN